MLYSFLIERTTLINVTLQSLPVYTMSAFQLPVTILDKISQKIKSYFWRASANSTKKVTALG